MGLFEPLAGFVAATLALWISPWIQPMDDRLATLASLIIILPGLSFTVAMTELASRHLTAGVARLAGTMVSFMTLTLGVALSWRLFAGIRPNDVARPDFVQPSIVRRQLKSLNVSSSVRFQQVGFPIRRLYRSFFLELFVDVRRVCILTITRDLKN